jgi:hypothetical protein
MSRKPFERALLFVGHMVDLPGRPSPRFPADRERAAGKAIADAVAVARQSVAGAVVGIASGARGGDILFHEACRLFGLETRMVLPFPPEDFIKTSVAGIPGANWEQRFWSTWGALDAAHRDIVQQRADNGAYALCNQRMLALAGELASDILLIAYWDGAEGDGPGGTASLVENVKRVGGKVEIIDAKSLLALAAGS